MVKTFGHPLLHTYITRCSDPTTSVNLRPLPLSVPPPTFGFYRSFLYAKAFILLWGLIRLKQVLGGHINIAM